MNSGAGTRSSTPFLWGCLIASTLCQMIWSAAGSCDCTGPSIRRGLKNYSSDSIGFAANVVSLLSGVTNPSSLYLSVAPSKRLHIANQASRCRVTESPSAHDLRVWRLPRIEYVLFLIYRNTMYILLSFYLCRLVEPILEFGTRT